MEKGDAISRDSVNPSMGLTASHHSGSIRCQSSFVFLSSFVHSSEYWLDNKDSISNHKVYNTLQSESSSPHSRHIHIPVELQRNAENNQLMVHDPSKPIMVHSK